MAQSGLVEPSTSGAVKQPTEWMPRFWLGSTAGAWFKLLARNRFAIEWPYWHMAAMDTLGSFCNSAASLAKEAIYARAVARTEIAEAPLFIIGHWRTGTTLLHELLIRDERHGFPTHYECCTPSHFLLTERVFSRVFWFLVPRHRPMDNMRLGWGVPQEDEFALANLGVPSPYATIAFPNHAPQFQEYLELRDLPRADVDAWKRSFLKFVKELSYVNQRRLVLKSPTHTWRVRVLLDLFPDARFVHIVRDPYTVFSSTVHLWKSLYRTQGYQTPHYQGLEEYVFRTYVDMHRALDGARGLVPPGRFHELRYEDLVADPVSELERTYEALELGDFEPARASVEHYAEGQRDYKTNRYNLSPQLHAEINRRWGELIRRYGYWRDAPDAAG